MQWWLQNRTQWSKLGYQKYTKSFFDIPWHFPHHIKTPHKTIVQFRKIVFKLPAWILKHKSHKPKQNHTRLPPKPRQPQEISYPPQNQQQKHLKLGLNLCPKRKPACLPFPPNFRTKLPQQLIIYRFLFWLENSLKPCLNNYPQFSPLLAYHTPPTG